MSKKDEVADEMSSVPKPRLLTEEEIRAILERNAKHKAELHRYLRGCFEPSPLSKTLILR